MINLDPVTNGRRAGSLTWAGLFNTHYWIDPSMRIAAVIMMQILPFADEEAVTRCLDCEPHHTLALPVTGERCAPA
jgi:hypothetical protein